MVEEIRVMPMQQRQIRELVKDSEKILDAKRLSKISDRDPIGMGE